MCNRGKNSGKTKAGSNVPELQMLLSLSQGDLGEHPDSPSLLNPLYWGGRREQKGVQLKNGGR